MSEAEWGGGPMRTCNPTAYNAKGDEIAIPRCPKCGVGMSQIIGKTQMKWICSMGMWCGDEKSIPKLVYRALK